MAAVACMGCLVDVQMRLRARPLGAGVAALLDVIHHLLPHPGEGNPPAFLRGEGAEAQPMQAVPDPALHVLAHVGLALLAVTAGHALVQRWMAA